MAMASQFFDHSTVCLTIYSNWKKIKGSYRWSFVRGIKWSLMDSVKRNTFPFHDITVNPIKYTEGFAVLCVIVLLWDIICFKWGFYPYFTGSLMLYDYTGGSDVIMKNIGNMDCYQTPIKHNKMQTIYIFLRMYCMVCLTVFSHVKIMAKRICLCFWR